MSRSLNHFHLFPGHPNVKAFITHGGLLGSSEAAHCGVPTIVTPMYGDQVELKIQTHA